MKTVNLFFLFILSLPALVFSQQGNSSDVQLLRGPYLQIATPTSMTIRWRTNVDDKSRISYGLNLGKLDMQINDATPVTEHIVKISGLKSLTKYYYAIGDPDKTMQGDENNYFYTLPEKGAETMVRIAGFGDCGNNSINQRNVRDQIIKYLGGNYLNAMILMGDNAYNSGTDAEFQAKFFNNYQERMLKRFPLFPVPGNHDYDNIESKTVSDQLNMAYYKSFSVPTQGEDGGVPSNTKAYYAYDVGNIHFLALDSYGQDNNGKYIYDELGEQAQWVKKDLAANTNKKWIIAYWHHPPFTMGSHDSDKEGLLVKIRENFIKILENNGVDLVLCGHSHVYERTKLIKGYYGKSNDFDADKFNLSNSSALYDGSKNSAPYLKSKTNTDGTVYVVSGSSGAQGGRQPGWPHKAMYFSNCDIGGAVMLEVQGNQLDLKWICADGKIGDHFTMMKDVNSVDEDLLKEDKILK